MFFDDFHSSVKAGTSWNLAIQIGSLPLDQQRAIPKTVNKTVCFLSFWYTILKCSQLRTPSDEGGFLLVVFLLKLLFFSVSFVLRL